MIYGFLASGDVEQAARWSELAVQRGRVPSGPSCQSLSIRFVQEGRLDWGDEWLRQAATPSAAVRSGAFNTLIEALADRGDTRKATLRLGAMLARGLRPKPNTWIAVL